MKRFILGSQSPRRLELLSQLVPRDEIAVMPPLNDEELDFNGLTDIASIQHRLMDVARNKFSDVCQQVTAAGQDHPPDNGDRPLVLTADTIIIAFNEAGQPLVLGKPPVDSTWPTVVREWFTAYLLPRPHFALTGLILGYDETSCESQMVQTEVEFHRKMDVALDWYLKTGESQGKAGGYAIQGAASLFVRNVIGSLSNVVGLPLLELARLYQKMGCDVFTR